MTNLFIILWLGGGLGWIFSARTMPVRPREAVTHILVGMVASLAAVLANQSSLYAKLTGESIAFAIAASLIALGALGLWGKRRPD